jgi:Na+:H+ antiporter, NhaA family
MSAPNEPRTPVRAPWSRTDRAVPRRIVQPLQQFMHLEISGGLVLLAATVVALLWANTAPGGYEAFWLREVTISIGDYSLTEDFRHVANDGLMALFFLVVGLEVKREIAIGELSTRQAALLPAFAAVGGMVVPALIFLGVTGGGPEANGWGIPMATDVAFALGALAALGRRVPVALMAFLLGVAVIDDIGAILVVALFYSGSIQAAWIALAVGGLAAMVVLQRAGVRHLAPYVVLGLVVWFATFESGVHATIAGVAIGLLTPVRPFQDPGAVAVEARTMADDLGRDGTGMSDASRWMRLSWLAREAVAPLTRVEHGVHQWSSFVVLPIFALANAGIVLDRESLEAAIETPVAMAVALGLVAGKMIGLTAGAALAVRLGVSTLPRGVGWMHVVGVGALAGIGFTVSLFITELAFDDQAIIDAAKIGVLSGSIIAAVIGISLLLRASRRTREAVTGAMD